MQLIKSKIEPLICDNYKKAIEIAGRTCYQSLDKITDDSADKFVNMIIEYGHNAMLEFGTIYLEVPVESTIPVQANTWYKYEHNKYSSGGKICDNGKIAYTTNYRVLIENNSLDDLQYICKPTIYHDKRFSVRITCSRAIANELVRHRIFSFAQESTRYCNYSTNKFNHELTFITPTWFDNNYISPIAKTIFINTCEKSEKNYNYMIESMKMTPQQVRDILPLSLKTEIVMCGFVSDWIKFFKLRDLYSNAHPDMKIIVEDIKKAMFNEFKELQ